MKPKQLKQKDLAPLREKLHKQQNLTCPVLGLPFNLSDMVIDHQHRTKAEPIGENGAGLVRGCIQFQANSLEGKIWNAWKRYGLNKMDVELPEFLRNLADYYERDCLPLIHPSEKPKEPKLSKACYNKLVKAMKGSRKKCPPFPKSGKLTKPLERLFKQERIEIKYLRG